MKIGFFGLKEQEKKDYFLKNLPEHKLVFFDDCLSDKDPQVAADFDIISTFVQCQVNEKVLLRFTNLKMIAVRSTGYDNIDLNYTQEKGIIVSNVPSYGTHTVAEFAFGLILSLVRHIPEASIRVKQTQQFDYQGLRGIEIYKKNLGVIGTGKIGSTVARIAHGFGMGILAYDTYPNEQLAKELSFNYFPLEQLLAKSDIITIHLPLTDQTKHLINQDSIHFIRKGAFLINTARGGIVKSQALLSALENQTLQGVALDVLEDEASLYSTTQLIPEADPKELEAQQTLIQHPKVIISPHMAFYTQEAEQAIMETTVANVLNFIQGDPINVVHL